MVSWDLILDGRRRFDIRVTLILAPAVGLVGWVHYAPALSDAFRKSYRRFLRWNDELPFTKFALAEDERVVLTSEVAPESIDRERLGITVARLLAICDLLLDESAHWLWTGGRVPSTAGRTSRGLTLLERFAAELAELTPGAAEPALPSTGEPTGPVATADEDETADEDDADDDSNGDQLDAR